MPSEPYRVESQLYAVAVVDQDGEVVKMFNHINHARDFAYMMNMAERMRVAEGLKPRAADAPVVACPHPRSDET